MINRELLYERLTEASTGDVIRSLHACSPNLGESCDHANAVRQWAHRHKLRFRFFHEGGELWAVRLNENGE